MFPLCSGIGTDDLLSDTLYPTTLMPVGTPINIASATLDLLRYFKWYHFTMLLDLNSSSSLYPRIARSIENLQKTHENSMFQIATIGFFGKIKESITKALRIAQKSSRGTQLIADHPKR